MTRPPAASARSAASCLIGLGRGPAPGRESRISRDAARGRRARPGARRHGPPLPRGAGQQPGILAARSARSTPSACRRSRQPQKPFPTTTRGAHGCIALLASELHYAGEPERCRALAAEAIEIARAAGDPDTLTYTLSYASGAISAPDTVQERRRLNGELVELAQDLDDPWFTVVLAARRVELGHITGDRSQIESGIATDQNGGRLGGAPDVRLAATVGGVRPGARSGRSSGGREMGAHGVRGRQSVRPARRRLGVRRTAVQCSPLPGSVRRAGRAARTVRRQRRRNLACLARCGHSP